MNAIHIMQMKISSTRQTKILNLENIMPSLAFSTSYLFPIYLSFSLPASLHFYCYFSVFTAFILRILMR